MSREHNIAAWEDLLSPVVGGLHASLQTDGAKLDYSAQSLTEIESLVLQTFDSAEEVLQADHRALVRGLIAYVGLSLVHLSTGRWDWDFTVDDSRSGWLWDTPEDNGVGVPVAVPGAGMTVAPVSPLQLLLDTATLREKPGSGPLVQTYTAWRQQVVDPPTEGVAGIDVIAPPPPSPTLDTWLAKCRGDFPRWAQKYDDTWDFSGDSIDRLTELARRLTPTVEAYNDPTNRDFVEGASWYLGETIVRGARCRWVHDDRDGLIRVGLIYPDDPELATFQIRPPDDSNYTTPFMLLRLAIRTAKPAARTAYDRWCRTFAA